MRHLVIPAMLVVMTLAAILSSPATPPITLVDTFEQSLTRDPDPSLHYWRFGRYEQPLAASVRVYADGSRLRQGHDYKIGRDSEGWYIAIGEHLSPSWVVVDFKE